MCVQKIKSPRKNNSLRCYLKVIFDLDLKGCIGICQIGRVKKKHLTTHLIKTKTERRIYKVETETT